MMTDVRVKNTAQNLPTIVALRTTQVVCSASEAACAAHSRDTLSGSEVAYKSVLIKLSGRISVPASLRFSPRHPFYALREKTVAADRGDS